MQWIEIRKKKFNISVNFENTKKVDHILKISRPDFLYIRWLNWNTAIIVFMKNAARIKGDMKVN